MGEKLTERNGEIDGKANEQGRAGGINSDSTSTTSAGSTGGRAGGRDGGNGTDENKTGEKIIPQLVTVDDGKTDEERKREERNAKRRERYAKQKAENGQSVKPRKVNQSKKQNETTFDRTQINALILSLSAIVASRPNCEQWLLTESEVDAITKPLCAMIAESDKLEMIAQNSNQIALAVACISVFAPRLLVTVQKAKEEKEKKKNVRQAEQTKADIERLNRNNDSRHAVDGKKSDNVVPFYGVPIS